MEKTIYSEKYKYTVIQLKKARKEAGLTQREVAEKLGKPQSFISKCESGQRRVDINELDEFTQIYKKSLNYFIKQFTCHKS